MSGFRMGSGFIGSDDILITSKTMTEIIPIEPKSYPYAKCHCYKLSFINLKPCHFVINENSRFYSDALEGWESTEIDAEIYSFIIEEENIDYKFRGAY